MEQIKNILLSAGFLIIEYDKQGFRAHTTNTKGIQLQFVLLDGILGAYADFNGLTKTVIDSSRISTVGQLYVFLETNLFVIKEFPALIQALSPIITNGDTACER